MSSKLSLFEHVPCAPEDIVFSVQNKFKNDTNPKKLNLGIGAYRDDTGKPWIFPIVKKVQNLLVNDKDLNHEYLDISGDRSLCLATIPFVFGREFAKIHGERIATVQGISGTGSLRLAADFCAKWLSPNSTVLISNPTWPNHPNIFRSAGISSIQSYRYWDEAKFQLDFAGMCQDILDAPPKSIIVLHSCAHNPTGVDPTQDQWKELARIVQECGHIPIFDSAYLGFASGDLDQDAFAIRHFASLGLEMFVSLSFAKNFGLYGQRVGALLTLVQDANTAKRIYSLQCLNIRSIYSSPPKFGASIVCTILNNPEYYQEWLKNVKIVSSRIKQMRQILYEALIERKVPGSWSHIINQIGMFGYTGLTAHHVQRLTSEYHIYLLPSGRISMAGLTSDSVIYFADALQVILSNSPTSNP